jgi:hypothetical protein
VSIGTAPAVSQNFYLDLFKKEIPDYMGGKKIVYLKVYGAKTGDSVTAECRVDDYVSNTLSEILHGSVTKWDDTKFASHKQFFFFVCDNPGLAYPYSQKQMDAFVKKTIELFCDRSVNYGDIFPMLVDTLNDASLAAELHGFIPELCAQMAFEKIISPDKFTISTGDGEPVEYTKWQITAYHMIDFALCKGFQNKIYPENAFSECVSSSSTYNVIQKAKENNVDLENGGKISCKYNFQQGYIAR